MLHSHQPYTVTIILCTADVTSWLAQGWALECPDVKNYKWHRLNPVWHKMPYSCTHMATVGVKGLGIRRTTVVHLLRSICDIRDNLRYMTRSTLLDHHHLDDSGVANHKLFVLHIADWYHWLQHHSYSLWDIHRYSIPQDRRQCKTSHLSSKLLIVWAEEATSWASDVPTEDYFTQKRLLQTAPCWCKV